ncbi:MAG: hypothetical protein ABI054_01055, partial [Planctomycetota bacterium]
MDSKPSRSLAKLGLIALASLALIALAVWFLRRDGTSAASSEAVIAPTPRPAAAASSIATVD